MAQDAGHKASGVAEPSAQWPASVRDAACELLQQLFAGYRGRAALVLWDGTQAVAAENPRCHVIFRHPGTLRAVALGGGLFRLAEDYLNGWIEVEGEFEAAFDLADYLLARSFSWRERLFGLLQALRLPAAPEGEASRYRADRDARRNSHRSISYHYDVSNEFYRLWLDPEMVYSCAYFRDEAQSLAEAQRDKLDYICRKLRLRPGMKLLDIGCGWGALVLWAARHYGVEAHGITLSKQQYEHAKRRAAEEGLSDRVHIELRDYRDLPKKHQYDRVVSVGMFEHVGVANYPVYFGTVAQVLKPGGLFLNHGITSETGWQRGSPLTKFMNTYVFPDGELARISTVCTAMEDAGFEIHDVEGLRRHYALTLRHWVAALEKHKEEAVKIAGEVTYRVWRLYMAGSAHYFARGNIGVYQVLASHRGHAEALPLRRDDLYRP